MLQIISLLYLEGDGSIPSLTSHSRKVFRNRTSPHGEKQLTMAISGSCGFGVACQRVRPKDPAFGWMGERSKEEANELEHDAPTQDE